MNLELFLVRERKICHRIADVAGPNSAPVLQTADAAKTRLLRAWTHSNLDGCARMAVLDRR